jgi:hypothetical protein
LMKLDLEKVRPVQTYVAYGTGGPINGKFFSWANKWYTYPMYLFFRFIYRPLYGQVGLVSL